MAGARIAIAVVAALAGGGCFTTWATIQIAGKPEALDESVRQETVAMPGVKEQLQVRLPLGDGTTAGPAVAPGAAGMTGTTAGDGRDPEALGSGEPLGPRPGPFELGCTTVQRAEDTVYRSAYRYGKKWKYGTAAMFVLEAAAASLYLLAGDREKPEHLLLGGFLGLDALGTAALFFAPRKEIYRSDVKPAVATIRTDCPDGLVLEIAGESYPVDAAGRIGELGFAALDEWMLADAPAGTVQLALDGRVIPLQLGDIERCSWIRHRHGTPPVRCPRYGAVRRDVLATLEVPLGTLSRAPSAEGGE